MNLAFSALLAFLLLIPGLLFLGVRRANAEFASYAPLPPQPFSVELGLAVLVSALLHGACILANQALLPFGVPAVNLNAVLLLMLGQFGSRSEQLNPSIESVTQAPGWVLLYFIGVNLLAAVSALAVAKLTAAVNRSGKWSSLIAASPHEAVIAEWKTFFRLEEKSDAIVTAVVVMGGVSYLFVGMLKRLHFDRATGELARLQLEDVYKRKLEESELRSVFGDQFILRYSEITTLNVVYVDQQIIAQAGTSPPSS